MPLTKSTLLFAIAAFIAHADLVQTVPFSFLGSSSGPVQQTISVPQFDPAQGTLKAVTLTIFPSFQFIFDVFDNGAGPVSVTASDTVSFNGAPIMTEGTFSSTIPANQTIYTFTPTAISAGPLTEFFDANTANLFVGTGTVPFSLSLSPPNVVQFSGSTVQNVLAFTGVSGTVTADYAFTPAATPVPEPPGLAAIGLVLVALSALIRVHLRRES